MRIAYICTYYAPAYCYGGPTKCSTALCEGLVRAGADVTVFTTNANGADSLDVPLCTPVDENGVTTFYFPRAARGLGFFYSPRLAKSVAQQMASFDIAVVSALWAHPLIASAKACLHSHVPYVTMVHGQLYPWAMAQKRMKKLLYLGLIGGYLIDHAAAIACTDASEAEAVQQFGFHSPTFVVPNSIATTRPAQPRNRLRIRQALGLPDEALVLLFLGRLTKIKRPDIAVDVLAAAQVLPHPVHLVVAGPDEDGLSERLHRQAEELGCASHLHLVGLLTGEAVGNALGGADLLLMPTEVQENFGLAALEALAAGTPILVSQGIPVGRRAMEAGAGMAVECTTDAFRQAALALLLRPDELSRMGQRGQELAQTEFDATVIAQRMLEQLQAIIRTGCPLHASGKDSHDAELQYVRNTLEGA